MRLLLLLCVVNDYYDNYAIIMRCEGLLLLLCDYYATYALSH